MYQLYARALGKNNLPDCSNMCHESSGSALNPTIGIGITSPRYHGYDAVEAMEAFERDEVD